jgi:hypothetical protein
MLKRQMTPEIPLTNADPHASGNPTKRLNTDKPVKRMVAPGGKVFSR